MFTLERAHPSMLKACYVHAMSAIQVKNVPADVHDALRAKAEAEGTTVGEVILEAVRRDLRRQSMREWLDHLEAIPRPDPPPSREQVDQIMNEVRGERRWDNDVDSG